ncbi:DNA polymerase III subunit alpha [Brachybacterium huguangmaarense]|uniref:DNA polymerase III subunit alpha n=1 Tax=Brachybacterium huguangmaarense TaxID=1652028 RepID=A0ABY6FXC9_9MICO|nr:DNA polymerase III subunit alpha [Brachybacterium huguangmaarense]UYG15578.1 DNA polymerase III subunit alpha [Brachybacterium huguangmaarense]
MASDDFVHLHVHTDYSLLDGAAKISKLVDETARQGQKAIAITDHGYVFGAYEFYKTAVAADIKPIIGVEAYVTPGTSRHDRTRQQWGTKAQQDAGDDVSARGAYTHLTLLSRTTAGMHNLFRLASSASLDGQMGKWPRMDREILSTYADGLIASTGCPSGEIQTRIRLGQWDEAVKAAGEFQDMFGKENYFVELMDHGLDLETRVTKDLIALSKQIGAPLLATNDLHYVTEDDAKIQDALLCINSGSTFDTPGRFKFDGSGYYLKSAAEMRELFRELPEACDNTLRVAEMCDVSFTTTAEGANFMPVFPTPPGEDEHSWFVKEVQRGLEYRFSAGIPDAVQKQADYEVSVITQMGFPGYFLVVSDFIRWAKENGIRVGPGRGSGAGSMVAYAMRITDLDPLEHGLLFERFLNPDRVSMPDFDVDFDDRRRGEVLEYVTRKYGDDRVAQVITYGVMKTKNSLKDASRVLGYPYAMGDRLTKALPPAVMGKDIPLSGIYDPENKRYAEAGEFRRMLDEDPDGQKVFEIAQGVEGLTRGWGVHACAVIMSSHTLTDIIPMMRRPSDGQIITQFDYPTCETLGLLKMDFLGLRNLTVISDALDNITRNGKEAPDLETLGFDDPPTYDLLQRGDTLGVFQLDGSGMRTLLRQMKPDKFGDISAVSALYRPGPMGMNSHTNYALRKNGLQEIAPIHPELEAPLADILNETYGVLVYQEQVMQTAQKVAGYSLGEADILRRAMGKKKKAELDKQFVSFEAGMKERGYSDAAVAALWETLLPFADYAFNKSHSAAYGVVSYWTAYLKANFPTEYMAALLTSTQENRDRLGLYLGDCRHRGITVLPPDVNESDMYFSAVGDDIRFGLSAVRNVGANVVEAILAARAEKGAFTSFTDFLDKVPLSVCNKRTIESLIKGGAFDSLGANRRSLVLIHEDAVDSVVDVKRKEAQGQYDLFGEALFGGDGAETGSSATITIPDLPEWDRKEKLSFERTMLGLYVSDHPLQGLEHVVAQNSTTAISALADEGAVEDGAMVQIAGLITSLQRKTTKKGDMWAIATVEDLEGSIDCLLFPSTYQTVATELAEDLVVSMKGRVDTSKGMPELRVMEMTIPDTSHAGGDGPVTISLPALRCTERVVTDLRGVLEDNPGMSEVRVKLLEPGRATLMRLDTRLSVTPSAALYASLKALLGPGCLQ